MSETFRRGTGGNRFIDHDATVADLLHAISVGLWDLNAWANDTGRVFDLGEVSVETRRIPSGAISVEVTADLQAHATAPTPPTAARQEATEA